MENFRTVLRSSSLTQRELSDELGVSELTVGRWVRGLAYPSIDKLPALSEILDCPIERIIASLLQSKEDAESLEALKQAARNGG